MFFEGKWDWGVVSPFVSYRENLRKLMAVEHELSEEELKLELDLLETYRINNTIDKYVEDKMLLNIRDYIGIIVPAKMIRFLQYRGWNEIPLSVDYKRVFQTEQDNKFYQVDVPVKTDLSDFKEAMLRATETLAETMHMTANEIIWTLLA